MDLIVLNGVGFGAIGIVLAKQIFGDGTVEIYIWGGIGFIVGVVIMVVGKISDRKKGVK